MAETEEDSIEELKSKLREYKRDEINFSNHAENQIMLREGNKEEIIKHITNPENLVYSYKEKGRYGEDVHCLHFNVSSKRTIRLPVIFDKGSKKGLYIITYIMRYRKWQNMIKRGRG